MINEIIATILLSGSIGSKTIPVTVPVHSEPIVQRNDSTEFTKNVQIHGVYNFRTNPSFSYPQQYYSHRFIFEETGDSGVGTHYKNLVPFTLNNNSNGYYFLRYIDMEYDDGYTTFDFYCYDGQEDLFTFSTAWVNTLENVTYRSLMFQVLTDIYIGGVDGWFFDNFFTLEDNPYVTSYTGYYSLQVGLNEISSSFITFGNMMFNNQLGYGLTNKGISSGMLGFFQYDLETGYYSYSLYSLPLNLYSATGNNMMFTNVKMSNQTRTVLESVGIFAYVKDSSMDNTTFGDMIYSVVDSPIYMLYRMLNFDLFGVNLFLALTAMLTLVVVIFCIKKFVL